MISTVRRFSATTLESKDAADTYPFRLVYTDHVPVSEWQVWYGTTLEEVNEKARQRAQRDLRPGSGVFSNVFIIQRWDETEWVDYDDNGDDLTDLAFGDDDE